MNLKSVFLSGRSVYLHNNKLEDAGLPESMFNGSNNVEVLIMSSNFLKSVPKNLPRALYKLHLKVSASIYFPLSLCVRLCKVETFGVSTLIRFID